MRRNPSPPTKDHRAPWQIAQAAICPCRGSDDYCACQNVDQSDPAQRYPSRADLEQRIRELEGTVRTLELQQQTDRQTIASLSARPPSHDPALLEALEELVSIRDWMIEVGHGYEGPMPQHLLLEAAQRQAVAIPKARAAISAAKGALLSPGEGEREGSYGGRVQTSPDGLTETPRDLEWRDIGSAPRDRDIIIGRFTGDPGAMQEGRVRVDRWYDAYDGFGGFNKQHWPATHWRPLPAAPHSDGKGA